MKKSLIGFIVILLIVGLFLVLRFSGQNQPTSGGKIVITTSFYPLFFFSSQIGGDKVSVQNITPSGAEPHDYEPTAQDIARIESSKLLVLNGAVEAWGDKIKSNLQGKNVKIVTAGEGLLTQQLTEGGETMMDPHVWLSPLLAKQEVGKITEALVNIDPEHTQYYQDNQNKLDTQLDQLDQAYKSGLSNCQKKDIITSHAAFGYLAKQYGLNQVAIAGLSPDAEPSPQQLAEITKFAKDNSVKYIFFESLVSPKLAQTIASEVGAQTLVLDPIEGVSDEDLKNGKNYLTIMQDNLKNLQIALECK